MYYPRPDATTIYDPSVSILTLVSLCVCLAVILQSKYVLLCIMARWLLEHK